MKELKGRKKRKWKESDARIAEWFCSITALLTAILCVLFVSGVLRNFWVLDFIFVIGILMNLSLILVSVIRKKSLTGGIGVLMLLAEATALVYFIM
ncbi:MAG: hypothetical protein LUH20_10145 [Lachnospiraceae bacterium]|nr:hypothetical protein [Lachnospiraceae bacterium]